MANERQCGECGGKLPADAPQGLCPQCLMKLGLPSESTVKESGVTDEQAAVPTSATPPGGFVPPRPEQLAEKFPQLEIIELLGQGGMGAVYKARQKQLDRLVALKILPPEVGQDPAFAERFSREARSLAKLNHSGIVSIYDFGHTKDGPYYFIMEFVDGTDLRRLIQAGHLEPRQALAIVPQICEALQYAHEEGLVHRDIKPENILLDKKGKVRIADFGLAKLLGKPATAYTLTQSGQRMGTPHYMAPEQIEGAHQVDHRADIYSLGVVFYEMLTGQLPIGRFAPPSQKVQVDVRLDRVVLKSLEYEPELRYQNASEVKSDVEAVSTGDRAPRTYDHTGGAERRFSRTAIIGACWSALALLWIPVAVIHTSKMQKSAMEEVVIWLCILIGSSPVFGTTILGIASITQIRQSAGRLCGMGLAVFDSLLFPVLGLDAAIFLILALLAMLTRIPWVLPFSAAHFAAILVLPVCGVVDYFIVRWALRKANAGLEQTNGPQQPGPPAPQRQEYRQAGEVKLAAEYRSPNERPLPESGRQIIPRFSRKAIAGAACIPLFVPLVVMMSTREGYERFWGLFTPPVEDWGQWVFTFIVSAVGVASPFATTILGFVSIWDVRRSQGTLAGLSLSVADAILFPLIIVDFFIFVISVSNYGVWGNSMNIPSVLPFVFLVCAIVDLLLIRWAWRKAKAGLEVGKTQQHPGRYASQRQESEQPHKIRMDAEPGIPTDSGIKTGVAGASVGRRFSRAAIVGACWAPLVLILVIPLIIYFSVISAGDADGHWEFTRTGFIVTFVCGILGLMPVFGTTILGIVAITHIRQSAGRMYGMGLALFDTLLFPLVLLNISIVLFASGRIVQSPLGYFGEYALLLSIAACPLIDLLIVRWAWRRANAISATESSG